MRAAARVGDVSEPIRVAVLGAAGRMGLQACAAVDGAADLELVARVDAGDVGLEAVRAAVAAQTGLIEQVPSSVSAIKVDGRRAYARVRAGEQVELPARPVTVHRFDVGEMRPAVPADATAPRVLDLDVTVECSSGTYVRALARDLGAALGVGGHLTALRRTRVGGYGLDVARTLEQLEQTFDVLPMRVAARSIFPASELDEAEARALSYGQRIDRQVGGPTGTADAPVAAFAPDGTLVALIRDDGERSRPVLVLAPA